MEPPTRSHYTLGVPNANPDPSFQIPRLGPAERVSPLPVVSERSFVEDEERIFLDPHLESVRRDFAAGIDPPSFEVVGPRHRIYFDPDTVRAAIVTCGGLSPGLNDVIRALVMQLWYRYGVRHIFGIGYGYQGLDAETPDIRSLEPEAVTDIHEQGGTLLGTSRGSPPTEELVDTLSAWRINILFTIGGDGTMRGAHALCREIRRRKLKIAVVGIPKTIDNDIPFVRRSFGFETAVMLASRALRSAHTEAESLRRGIGLVKLMGRNSGYIAANATLANGDANFCLVPEVPFSLEGPDGLLALLDQRLETRHHALIVVAEGAGQYYFREEELGRDASGNRRLGDIGPLLKQRIAAHVSDTGLEVGIKYIDPSYLIRSAPANPSDSLFCARLAHNAVHAAMAGKTALLIGYWHGQMTHVPFSALQARTKTIDPKGDLWRNVLGTTGQPSRIGSREHVRI
jgi:6-phosphofructokinase 1